MVGFGLTDIGERGGATQDGKTLNPKQFESVTYQILIKPKQRWKNKLKKNCSYGKIKEDIIRNGLFNLDDMQHCGSIWNRMGSNKTLRV